MAKYSDLKTLVLDVLVALIIVVVWTGCGENNGKDKSSHPSLQRNSVNMLIQQAIDFDDLQDYLHPEIEGREIVCIAGSVLPDHLELSKHGRPVEIISSPTECDNCIIFLTFEVENNKAWVVLDYAIEGVRCDLKFELKETGWKLVSSEITEH